MKSFVKVVALLASTFFLIVAINANLESEDLNTLKYDNHIFSSTSSQVSSTSTAISRQPCSPSCSACNAPFIKPKIPRSSPSKRMKNHASAKNISKRVLKTPQRNYGGNAERFMITELLHAERLNIERIPIGAPSAMIRTLGNRPYSAAVTGLYGCTSVIVASRQAVWLSHFWETNSFRSRLSYGQEHPTSTDIIRFDREVIQNMRHGDGTDQMPGLEEQTAVGGPFHAAQNPVWLIATPFGVDNLINHGYPYMYLSEVVKIALALKEILPGAPDKIINYAARSDTHAQQLTASGKILFQYDPVQELTTIGDQPGEVLQTASFNLWVEDNLFPVWSQEWLAEANQLVPQHTY